MPDKKPKSKEEVLEGQLDLAYQGRMNNIKESFDGILSVLKISKAQKLERIVARSHNYLGLLYMIQGDHVKSIAHSQQALDYFQQIQSLKEIADAKFNIASSLYKTDNFHDGLKGLLECKQIYQSIGDGNSECKALKSIATIYEFWGDINKAFLIYKECIELAIKNDNLAMLSNAYNPLSGLYLKRGDIDTATKISDMSIAIKKKIKDERGLAYSIYGKGKVFFAQKKLDLAEACFLQTLELQQKFGDKMGEGMVLNKLGLTYLEKKNYPLAEKVLTQSIIQAEKYNVNANLFKSYHSLYKLYKEQGEDAKALQCLELFILHKENNVKSHTSDIIKSYEAANEIYKLEQDTKAQMDYLEVVQKKNTELDSFFYRVSHDLKGPISSLLGLNSLIEKEPFDEEVLKYFAMYKKLSMRIDAIVMDLIDITRISSHKIVPVKINFMQLIEDCIHSYSYFNNFDRIEFRIEVEEKISFKSEWVIVNTILQNLIENSIKYIRTDIKNPYVLVQVYTEGSLLYIKVTDNGQGIAEEYQEKIYDMFFRANERVDGSGLGLYILKRAVERLEGTVTLKSKPGKGATFTVCIKGE